MLSISSKGYVHLFKFECMRESEYMTAEVTWSGIAQVLVVRVTVSPRCGNTMAMTLGSSLQ